MYMNAGPAALFCGGQAREKRGAEASAVSVFGASGRAFE